MLLNSLLESLLVLIINLVSHWLVCLLRLGFNFLDFGRGLLYFGLGFLDLDFDFLCLGLDFFYFGLDFFHFLDWFLNSLLDFFYIDFGHIE